MPLAAPSPKMARSLKGPYVSVGLISSAEDIICRSISIPVNKIAPFAVVRGLNLENMEGLKNLFGTDGAQDLSVQARIKTIVFNLIYFN